MAKLKENIWIILIIALGIFLRLNYDIFIPGYNYDEIAIASVAKQSFPFGILNEAAKIDYHAPLYQLIIHFFTYLENEWIYIRIFNLILSIINIYVFYKIGCLIKNKKTGIILALLLCVNHLEISMVSFVKFYCMAFLLFSINIYYFIKIIKKDKGQIKFGISNALFVLTNTLGFIVITIEYIYLFFIKKKVNKKIITSSIISAIGFILYLPILISQTKLSFNNILSPHSYYVEFSIVSFFNAMNDYFSPLLNYCCNLITVEGFAIFLKLYLSIIEHEINLGYLFTIIIFSYIPVICGLIGIYIGIKSNKLAKNIGIIAGFYLLTFILLTKLSITGFIPIYLFAFQVMLLILAGVGILEINNKKIQTILILCLILPQIFVQNYYPQTKRGIDRAKNFYCYEKYFKDNSNEFKNTNTKLITTLGGRFLAKYYKNKPILDFDNEKLSGLFQREYIELIYGKDFSKNTNKKNIRENLKKILKNKKKNAGFEEYFKNNILNNTKKGEKIILSFFCDENTSFIPNEDTIDKVIYANNKYNYKLTKGTIKEALREDYSIVDSSNIAEVMRYYSYTYLFELLDKNYKKIRLEQYTRTNQDDFIKIFETTKVVQATKWYAQNCSTSWVFITYIKE